MDNIGYDAGLLLKELRERANLTQKQLGNKVGVSEAMISRYESNMSSPTFDKMRAFAAIFNVSMDYLAGMEKRNTLSIQGLTEDQTDIMAHLAELFRAQNIRYMPNLTLEQYEVLGRIVANFSKSR